MPTYPDQVRAAERAALRKRRGLRRGKAAISALRVAELDREFTDRYGGEILPDDDAARDDVWIMANHLGRRIASPRRLIVDWLDRRAPWCTGAERDTLITRVVENPLRWKADTLARKIGLTAARRDRLRIRTIGAVDQTAEERKVARKQRDIDRKRNQRRADGIGPRSQPDVLSLNARAPWKTEGIDRRTWFRRRAKRHHATSHGAV